MKPDKTLFKRCSELFPSITTSLDLTVQTGAHKWQLPLVNGCLCFATSVVPSILRAGIGVLNLKPGAHREKGGRRRRARPDMHSLREGELAPLCPWIPG